VKAAFALSITHVLSRRWARHLSVVGTVVLALHENIIRLFATEKKLPRTLETLSPILMAFLVHFLISCMARLSALMVFLRSSPRLSKVSRLVGLASMKRILSEIGSLALEVVLAFNY